MDWLNTPNFELKDLCFLQDNAEELYLMNEQDQCRLNDKEDFKSELNRKLPLVDNEVDYCDAINREECSLFDDNSLNTVKHQEFINFDFPEVLEHQKASSQKEDILGSSMSNLKNEKSKLKTKCPVKAPPSTRSSPREKKKKNYTTMVDCLLDSSLRNSGVAELCFRKDVIHKRIMRGFKKFIVKLFDSIRIRPCRLKNRDTSFKQEMIHEAQRLNIINSEESEQIGDLNEFLCWMAMSKNTQKTKSLFDVNNKSILLMNEILSKYSHSKLEGLYGDSNIGMLFHYFIINGLEDFLDACPSDKKDLYQKYSLLICNNFRNYY
ncbi:unnamed protein product [Moneuplotes crassus]|uniref:Uncharacterized protein n=1 Tax=Euplotes crassus TaxID=5936 RepID=A0AAD1U5Q3_EUPCR|nr:unnamed protein product [Moneuplotes crassus]